jgi:hypothetical protein
LNKYGEVRVIKQVLISFKIEKFKDEIIYNVIYIHTTHLLLGRPWQFDRKVKRDRFINRYVTDKDLLKLEKVEEVE